MEIEEGSMAKHSPIYTFFRCSVDIEYGESSSTINPLLQTTIEQKQKNQLLQCLLNISAILACANCANEEKKKRQKTNDYYAKLSEQRQNEQRERREEKKVSAKDNKNRFGVWSRWSGVGLAPIRSSFITFWHTVRYLVSRLATTCTWCNTITHTHASLQKPYGSPRRSTARREK